MSERIEILKSKFEKKLKRLKEKSILVNENIHSIIDDMGKDEIESRFFGKDLIKKRKKSFNKAKKKLKVAQDHLKACLKEDESQTDIESMRDCSEKYEDFALANLNLANFCIQQAELAAIKAFLASIQADSLIDLEESYTD